MYVVKNTPKVWRAGRLFSCNGYLKFITDRFPDGLFGGLEQAKKFNSFHEAEGVIRTIKSNCDDLDWANGLEIISFEREKERLEKEKQSIPQKVNVWTKEFWGG